MCELFCYLFVLELGLPFYDTANHQ